MTHDGKALPLRQQNPEAVPLRGAGSSWRRYLEPGYAWQALKRFSRYWYLRLLRIQATPHNIAMGLAAGVFIGLLPVLPFQTVLAVALAFVVRGSKIAAALGTWVSNPLNWVPCYIAFYKVGRLILPFEVPPLDLHRVEMAQLVESGWRLFAVMMTGGLAIALPSSVLAYFVAFRLIAAYRRRKAARAAARTALCGRE